MRVDSFDFDLPDRLIATEPLANRDASRMLVVNPNAVIPALSGDLEQLICDIQDDQFSNLISHLKPGDVLVLNNTKVMHARLFAKRGEAKVELLLHQQLDGDGNQWKAFARPAKKLKPGDIVALDGGQQAEVIKKLQDGQVVLDMRLPFAELTQYLDKHGHVPLPPYIQKHREDDASDKNRYQTVFSEEEKKRSVAAPTAGLHFTEGFLEALTAGGIHVAYITLHVGAGTFLPVKAESTEEHVMHYEQWEVSEQAAATINQAKQQGGRVVAVGTTSLRTLESAIKNIAENGALQSGCGNTNLFVTPGYQFGIVDVLFTNFHLPKSTLFMLVSAFAGLDVMRQAYQHAINNEYRFYSYGDACLLHRVGNP